MVELAEAVAGELMQRGRRAPGSSMADLARALGAEVFTDPTLARARGWTVREEGMIILRPSGYRPRDEFTIAHELLELFGPWSPDVPAEMKERLCDRGAAALLLPQSDFLGRAYAERFDLAALRRRWPRVSWSAIAARMVDLVPGASTTTWVNGRRARARGEHEDPVVRELAREARGAAMARGHQVVRRGSRHAAAWRLTASRGRLVVLSVVAQEG